MSNSVGVSAPIDLKFRPASYFWPLGLEKHLLARVKGAQRKRALQDLIDAGRHDEIPDFLATSALSEEERRMFGSIHPMCMGGEYLPDMEEDEVEIARISAEVKAAEAARNVRRFTGRGLRGFRCRANPRPSSGFRHMNGM
jgi:hypothetical protein